MAVPIVALTARATSADREQCMAAGMDEYVSKPIDPKLLYRLVSAYPARGRLRNLGHPRQSPPASLRTIWTIPPPG